MLARGSIMFRNFGNSVITTANTDSPQQYEVNAKKYKYKSDTTKKSPSASHTKSPSHPHIDRSGHDADPSPVDSTTSESGSSVSVSNDFGKRKVSRKHAARAMNSLTSPQLSNNHLLIPKGRTAFSSHDMKDRMKHPKLVGADIYVTRLVNSPPVDDSKKGRRRKKQLAHDGVNDGTDPDCCASPTLSAMSTSSGSLHDELACKEMKPQQPPVPRHEAQDRRAVAESRPCYRCVSYMHSVGIKRVFWTNSQGTWEGAKVRDLMDQLDGAMTGPETDKSLGLPLPQVFVTKHEVLLLRRLMGAEG